MSAATAPPPYDIKDYPPPPSYGTNQQYRPAPPQMHNNMTTNVVLVNQPQPVGTVIQTRFGVSPTPFKCRFCHTQQVSNVSQEPSAVLWLLVFILCVLGLWPFCLIPFCIDSFYDVSHTCPNCNNQVGVFRRS